LSRLRVGFHLSSDTRNARNCSPPAHAAGRRGAGPLDLPMPTVLILSKHAAAYRALVERERLPDLSIISTTTVTDLPPDASRAEIAFGEPSLIRDALPRLPSLKWAQSTWAGVEPLLDPSLRRDYVLTNARGVFGGLMSEYVFGYLLAHERRMFAKHAAQQAGRWDPTPPGTLRGKWIGLLGVGSIGAVLARTAKHFGMRVKGYTRASEGCPDVDEYFHADRRAAFASDLDYLVSIMPNTPATRDLVDAELLGALPPRAVFVNPGRGTSVDEAALAEALQKGRLAGAVLDVFQQEPLPPDHVFWRTANVIITSHTAALSFPPDIAPVFIDNYRRWIAGETLKYRVDFERGY
jgi:phosphoglycerate dehydrogenase-like enzyme